MKIYSSNFLFNLLAQLEILILKDSETDIQIKFNLYLCLFYDKKYQEAYMIVSINWKFFSEHISWKLIFFFCDIKSLTVFHRNNEVLKCSWLWENSHSYL